MGSAHTGLLGVPLGTPVLVGEQPFAVFALVGLPVTWGRPQAVRLQPLAQAREERGAHPARQLLVAPQVQLGGEQLVTGVAAERGGLCERCGGGGWVGTSPAGF